jgi:hypothetical protein
MAIQDVSTAEVDAVRTVVAAQQQSRFLQSRRNRNVLHPPERLENETFWKQMVVCMCTSVQPSGPNSRVSKLARGNPFPLALETCESESDLLTACYQGADICHCGPQMAASNCAKPTLKLKIPSELVQLLSHSCSVMLHVEIR